MTRAVIDGRYLAQVQRDAAELEARRCLLRDRGTPDTEGDVKAFEADVARLVQKWTDGWDVAWRSSRPTRPSLSLDSMRRPRRR